MAATSRIRTRPHQTENIVSELQRPDLGGGSRVLRHRPLQPRHTRRWGNCGKDWRSVWEECLCMSRDDLVVVLDRPPASEWVYAYNVNTCQLGWCLRELLLQD